MLRLLVAGITMIPAGILVISMALGDDPVFPTGLYTGPVLIVLGIVLAIISGRNLTKPKE